jgi:hypothetical protein
MTKPRRLPAGYIAFIVEATEEFKPTNWRETPSSYRVLESAGPMKTLGSADAWRFMFNQAAIKSGQLKRWAIHVSIRSESLTRHTREIPAAMAARQASTFERTVQRATALR